MVGTRNSPGGRQDEEPVSEERLMLQLITKTTGGHSKIESTFLDAV